MAFNVDKCKVMHVNRTNIHSNLESLKNSVIVVDDLMVAYSKANRTLGMIRRTIRSRDIGIMLSVYKTLVRPQYQNSWRPEWNLRIRQCTVRSQSGSGMTNCEMWLKLSKYIKSEDWRLNWRDMNIAQKLCDSTVGSFSSLYADQIQRISCTENKHCHGINSFVSSL